MGKPMLWGALGLIALLVLGLCGILAFDAPRSPPAMASMATPFKQVDFSTLPAPQRFTARDGTALQYYAYPGASRQVAVLIHGSGGPGTSMHALAQALSATGITAYALDMRGHGGSGPHGDIAYVGQLDDDLADFVATLGPKQAGETRVLVGFSAGAGFAIRFAGGRYGALFDRYVFLSPILPGAPTLRTNAGGWIDLALPRLIVIDNLHRLGIRWFDGLPVIAYAVTPEMSEVVTASYSYRLTMNFGAGPAHDAYLRGIRQKAILLVGSADEQVDADQFAPLLRRLDVAIPVQVVPGMKHSDMIAHPAALAAIVAAMAEAR